MSVAEAQLSLDEFLVVFLHVACAGFFEQVVAVVHQHAERAQRAHHLRYVGDNRVFFVLGQRGHIVLRDGRVEAEFHHFRIHEHEFQLVRVLFVEQRSDDGVQSDGLTLTRGTGHEQVRNLRQIGHIHLVGDGFSECDGQVVGRFLEFFRVQNALHRHDGGFLVRHLDADGSLARHGRDDADAEGREVQRNVFLECLNARDFHARSRRDFVERDGGAHGGVNLLDGHAKRVEHLHDALVVAADFLHIHLGFARVVVFFQQVERGEFVVEEGFARIDGCFPDFLCRQVALGFFLFFRHFYHQFVIVVVTLYGRRLLRVVVVCRKLYDGRWLRLFNNGRRVHHGSHGRLLDLVLVGDREFDFRREVFHGVQHLAHHVDGFGAQIGEEGQRNDEQDGRQSRRSHEVFHLLHAEQAVVSARVIDLLVHERREEFRERHRAPNHHQRHAEEPFPEIYLIDAHQPQSGQHEEGRNQESRQSEVHRDEVIRNDGAERAAVVGKLSVGIQPFARTHILKQALVGLSGVQVRNHRNDGVDGRQNEYNSQYEIEFFVV